MKIYYKNKNRTQMIIIIKVIKRRMVIINLIMKISIDFIYIFMYIKSLNNQSKIYNHYLKTIYIVSFDLLI